MRDSFSTIALRHQSPAGYRTCEGLAVFEPEQRPDDPNPLLWGCGLVGTCSPHDVKILASTIGVSGPANRGLSKTRVPFMDQDDVVICVTDKGFGFGTTMFARLTPGQAKELAVRIWRAAHHFDVQEAED